MNNILYERHRMIKYCISCLIALGILILSQIAFTQEQAPITIKEALESSNRNIQNKTIDSILQDRLSLVNMLIEIVDQANTGKTSEQAGNAAAYLLGKMRAPEAVPVLSIAFVKFEHQDVINISDPLTNAVSIALVRIGRPSIPSMITNITTSDDQLIRIYSMGVIYQVLGGKDNLIRLLNRLIEQEERTEEEKARIKKSLEWAQSHYKETTKPLY